MKLRLIAVLLILFVAAWLPILAQQSPSSQPAGQQPAAPSATDPGKAADKAACYCSGHQNDNSASAHCCQGKNAKANGSSSCCHGKNAEAMACCKEGQDKQATATCCKGKHGQMCAKQDGKGCCDSSACKSCGDKNATAANRTQSCCPAMDCCHHNSKA